MDLFRQLDFVNRHRNSIEAEAFYYLTDNLQCQQEGAFAGSSNMSTPESLY
jgi:hypothetical protein